MKREIDEAAVWQRVTAAAKDPGTARDMETTPLNLELMEALRGGKALAQQYRLLSRSGKSGYKALFDGQKEENQQLLGLWALQAGKAPVVSTAPSPMHKSYLHQIRWLLEAQNQQQRRLVTLSGRLSENQASLVSHLAQQAGKRWCWLLGELGRSS